MCVAAEQEILASFNFLAGQYIRTFTQVSVQWQDTDSMREELDDLQVSIILIS